MLHLAKLSSLSRRGILRNLESPNFITSLTRFAPLVQIREYASLNIKRGFMTNGGNRRSDFSVYDAFKRGLNIPGLTSDERPFSATGQGGQYTKLTRPPKLWAPLDFDDSISAALKFVEDLKEELSDCSAVEVAGLTEINKRTCESDIIKLFSLLVMHPVEIALKQIKLPDAHKINVRCEVHPEDGRAVRVDLVLEAENTETKTVKVLAVMEMKNFGVIKDEMGHIMAAKVASVQEAQKLAPTSKVRFLDDSMFLLRQCAAYATKFKTRHIGLCDWSVAIYLDFAQLPEALAAKEEQEVEDDGGFAGNFVLMYAQTNPDTFHYALLAFFKGAVDEWVQSF